MVLSSWTIVHLSELPAVVEGFGVTRTCVDAVFYIEKEHGDLYEKTFHLLPTGFPLDADLLMDGIIVEMLVVPETADQNLGSWDSIAPIRRQPALFFVS